MVFTWRSNVFCCSLSFKSCRTKFGFLVALSNHGIVLLSIMGTSQARRRRKGADEEMKNGESANPAHQGERRGGSHPASPVTP
eukprot:9481436-Pyramimonas_sp.AAC.2